MNKKMANTRFEYGNLATKENEEENKAITMTKLYNNVILKN